MKKFSKKSVVALFAAFFAAIGFVGCKGDGKAPATSGDAPSTQEITVYMPDGAPAMAFAALMQSDTKTDGITYRVVNPSVIATKVKYEDASKNADVCVLPITAASKLLGNGEQYQMLGTVTNGNLYILSKNEGVIADFEANENDLSHLLGKTVGVMKINEVPGMTFKCILDGYGVAWQELKNDGEVAADKVNLKAIADATAIDPLDTSVACYVVAEPAASVRVKKNGFTVVGDLNDLYVGSAAKTAGTVTSDVLKTGATQGFAGYPQAVLVAKKSLIESEKARIEAFMDSVNKSCLSLLNGELDGAAIVAAVTAHLEDSSYATTLNAGVLSQDVVLRCGVGFVESSVCADAVKSYLRRIIAVNASAAKEVGDKFFYFDSSL